MIEVYIDGASAGDPGPSGAGIFIKNNGKTESFSIPLGNMNNHEAEFHALIKSMEICIELGFSIVSIRSDSTAVVDAVEKEYARNEKYRLLLKDALSLASQFDLFFIKWIPSKENKHADQLARKGIRLNA
ncbi:reverse transcriptase-like protein [Bacillus sp. IITD106]|nr:reverse transcriptase-like protein [Bacillus sp. IITD106]